MAGRADSVMAQDFLTDVDAPALLGRLKEAVYRVRMLQRAWRRVRARREAYIELAMIQWNWFEPRRILRIEKRRKTADAAPAAGGAPCAPCAAGGHSAAGGSTRCPGCPAGKWQGAAGAPACAACGAGKVGAAAPRATRHRAVSLAQLFMRVMPYR